MRAFSQNKLHFLNEIKTNKAFNKFSSKNFGILDQYNERKNKKLVGNALFNDEAKFWVTSARPPNFGDHLDVRTKLDNWFDENRYYI